MTVIPFLGLNLRARRNLHGLTYGPAFPSLLSGVTYTPDGVTHLQRCGQTRATRTARRRQNMASLNPLAVDPGESREMLLAEVASLRARLDQLDSVVEDRRRLER